MRCHLNSDLENFCRAFREISWDFHGPNGLKSILTTLSICPRSVFLETGSISAVFCSLFFWATSYANFSAVAMPTENMAIWHYRAGVQFGTLSRTTIFSAHQIGRDFNGNNDLKSILTTLSIGPGSVF